ncbi:helix-turn-helix domain-containing protein [Sporosarcina sp. YIM B06819]|uniref:helix-turn-helix domain-containing protein n=1 Tax=Sporosarcina sp. YIM B06819 TaxID=3081769 RepID=UPI00298CE4EF|nr:helix-turn-helix domain-containing protein [Sporosarcina sp. YIM B06819]
MGDLGEKISYFRKAKGLTIKELAEDLCDDSTIYRLEKGKQLPRLEILSDICLKLEIPFKALFPFDEEVDQLKKMCREFTYIEDFLSLEIALEECDKVLEELDFTYSRAEFKKFILWHQAILLHKKEHNAVEALKILTSLVDLKRCVSELDISIMNSIGLIHLSTKNIDAALEIYKDIYPKINNKKVVEDVTLLPRVGYNYAHSMYTLQSYGDALEIMQEVLYYVETHQLIYLLGEIYHMIGISSTKKGYLIDAEEAFKNAILVFTLTKQPQYLAIAEEDLAELINQ